MQEVSSGIEKELAENNHGLPMIFPKHSVVVGDRTNKMREQYNNIVIDMHNQGNIILTKSFIDFMIMLGLIKQAAEGNLQYMVPFSYLVLCGMKMEIATEENPNYVVIKYIDIKPSRDNYSFTTLEVNTVKKFLMGIGP